MLNRRLYLLTLFLQFIAPPLICSQSRAVQEQEQKALTYNQIVQQAATRALHLPVHLTDQAICLASRVALNTCQTFTTLFSKKMSETSQQVPTDLEHTQRVFSGSTAQQTRPISKRQKDIAQFLCKTTELPYEIINLIITYDTTLFSTQHSKAVIFVDFLTPQKLISASKDNTIRVWNLASGACLTTVKHRIAITALAVISDHEIAAGEGDHSIKIWNTDTGECTKTLTGHDHNVTGLVTLPNRMLASGAPLGNFVTALLQQPAGVIKIWNIDSEQAPQSIERPQPIYGLWASQQNLLAAATDLYRETTTSEVNCPHYIKAIVLIDPATGILEKELEHDSKAIASYTMLDASTAISADSKQNIHIHTWHPQSSQERFPKTSTQKYSPLPLPTLVQSYPILLKLLQNRLVASAGWSDKKIRIIDPYLQQCTRKLPTESLTTALASLDGSFLAVGSADGKLELIDPYDDTKEETKA